MFVEFLQRCSRGFDPILPQPTGLQRAFMTRGMMAGRADNEPVMLGLRCGPRCRAHTLQPLLSGRRIYPSTTTARVGPGNLGRDETVCTIKAEIEAVGVVAIGVAPRAPKIIPIGAVTPPSRFDVAIRLKSSA